METLTGDEKIFYDDQKSDRLGRISSDIDVDYVVEQGMRQEEERSIIEREEQEAAFMMDIDEEEATADDVLNSTAINQAELDQSANRSGLTRSTKLMCDASVQTEPTTVDRPKMRIKERVCTDDIKKTCGNLSAVCGISVENSRLAVKTVAKKLYNHDFFLTKSEMISQIETEEIVEPAQKQVRVDLTYVLPSARTIADFKQMMASQVERDAAVALTSKDAPVKATLHYDATTRNNIDGEWPSIIICLSDGQEFVLRPMFFAYEDRQQITELLIETYERLAVAATVHFGKDIKPVSLWEKTDAFMSDSVSKNLKVVDEISSHFKTNYKPHHLLCKSHTVEKLDATNLNVLSIIEKKVKQRQTFEDICPGLRSFFRGKKTTVEAGIDALLNLVAHEKSGKTCNLATLFDRICERQGTTKRIFLYQERRFAKLGKAAAAIVEAFPVLKILLSETTTSNQLIEACKIYVESELFYTELETLAFFNFHVTFPFLNAAEVCSQTELCELLPRMFRDLLEKKTDTLRDYVVKIRRVTVNTPHSDLGKHIIRLMCVGAADGILLQCGREYGFDVDASLRATDISSMTNEERDGLPTNNLITERNLAVFDKRAAKVAKCRNFRFTGKSIRNDLMLFKGKQETINKSSKIISRLLCVREKVWTEEQKKKMTERLDKKLKDSANEGNLVKKLLEDCKSWNGPFTSAEEMMDVLKSRPDQAEFIVKTEMQFFAHTHKTDKVRNPELYRQNKISHEEKMENLLVLLSNDNDQAKATIANLPTNEDVMKAICISEKTTPDSASHETSNDDKVEVNQLCAVWWWKDDDSKYEWYIGYILKIDDGKYEIDHLEREVKSSNKKWKYPLRSDIQTAEECQVFSNDINGVWEYESRYNRFILGNEKEISYDFTSIVSS